MGRGDMSQLTPDRFGCVIVNYNGAAMAMDAALSFLGAGGARVVIVDNQSTDGSLDYLAGLAAGKLVHVPTCVPEPLIGHLPHLATHPKIQVIRKGSELPEYTPLSVIDAGSNGGFAAGCNIGLKALTGDQTLDGFVLLNPDTQIAAEGLNAFSARLADPAIGICGGTIVDFDAPHHVQAFGGAQIDQRFHLGVKLGEGTAPNGPRLDLPACAAIEDAIDYPLGAAMAIRRDYWDAVGGLDERYFLYFEEPDWVRAGQPTYRPGWAPEAMIYHRYGMSSVSQKSTVHGASRRSALADFHMTRSRLLFAAKWYPETLGVNRAAVGWQIAQRLIRGRPANAVAVAKAILAA